MRLIQVSSNTSDHWFHKGDELESPVFLKNNYEYMGTQGSEDINYNVFQGNYDYGIKKVRVERARYFKK